MAPTSGYINTPPGSDLDRRIVKGMLLYSGLNATENAIDKGVSLTPKRPDGYVFETRGPGIIAGLSVCILVITAVTGLRLCLRRLASGLQWGLDDSLMVAGLLMAIAYPALQIAMVVYGGAGKHVFDVSYVEYYHYKWLANMASIDFFVCVGVIKMSITAFNVRLTSMTSTKWRSLNWVFFGLCGIYTLVAFFINIFQCNPAGASFDLLLVAASGKSPQCEGVTQMGTILRTINFVLDWCLVLIPMAVLWKVKMSSGKKARLLAAMTVGSLACIASVMTLIAKKQLKTDPLWNYTAILGWSLAELTIGTVAASLPTLAFLFPLTRQGRGSAASHQNAHVHLSSAGARHNSMTSGPSSSREGLAAAEDDNLGITRTIEIELESKKRGSSDFDSQEHVVATYGLGSLRDDRPVA